MPTRESFDDFEDLEPFSFETDGLDKIMAAIKARTFCTLSVNHYAGRLLTFVSKRGVPADFVKQFRALQIYLRARFGVRMVSVSGGQGCQKFTMLLQGSQEDVEKAHAFLKQMDPDLARRLRRMNIDYFTDGRTQEQVFTDAGSAYPPLSQGRHPLDVAGFDKVSALQASIQSELKNLQTGLSTYTDGPRLYTEYARVLRLTLESLLNQPLVDEKAWARLEHLSQVIYRKYTNAGGSGERIMGAVQMILSLRYMNAA